MTEKKSILITGASSGIGFFSALHFCKKGYQVFATVRKESDGQKLVEHAHKILPDLGGKIIPLIVDVTQSAQIVEARKKIESQCDSLSALVNNAGIVVGGPIEAISIDKIRQQFDINVFGLLEVTQNFLPLIRKGKGRIINLSSIAGLTVTPFLGPYCASKHSVEVFSDALRMELTPDGIKVVLIEPGSIATPIWDKSITNAYEELKVSASPEHIARYNPMLKAMDKVTKMVASKASPVEIVVEKIVLAVESKNPATRYLVGTDAKLGVWQNILSDKLLDRVLLTYIKKFGST